MKVFFIFLLVLIAGLAGYFGPRFLEYSKSQQVLENSILKDCGVENISDRINIKNEPLVVDLETKPSEETDETAIYQNKYFSISYPSDRKISESDRVFGMCPVIGCQDREMFVEPIDETDSLLMNNICQGLKNLEQAKFVGYSTQTNLYTDFRLGPYKGIALTNFLDADEPFAPVDLDPSMDGYIFVNNKMFRLGLNPRDESLVRILKTFSPR